MKLINSTIVPTLIDDHITEFDLTLSLYKLLKLYGEALFKDKKINKTYNNTKQPHGNLMNVILFQNLKLLSPFLDYVKY